MSYPEQMEVYARDCGMAGASVLGNILFGTITKINGEFEAGDGSCVYKVSFVCNAGRDGMIEVLSGVRSADAVDALRQLDQLIQEDGWRRIDQGQDWYSYRYERNQMCNEVDQQSNTARTARTPPSQPTTQSGEGRPGGIPVIILGLILLALGYLLAAQILWILGIILLLAGGVIQVMRGVVGHKRRDRRSG